MPLLSPRTLGLVIAAAIIATDAGAQGKSAPRLLTDSDTRALLASTVFTAAPGESRYLHRITELTMGDGVPARVETWVSAPDKILTIVSMPGLGESKTGYDGNIGWSTSALTGAVILESRHVNMLLGAINSGRGLNGLRAQPSPPTAKVYTTGRAKIDRRAVNTFLLVDNGDSARLYVDAETGALAGVRHLHAGKERLDTTALTLLSDYKLVDGIMQPLKSTVRGKGKDFVARIVALDHEPIDSAKFAPPPAVLALLSRKP